MCVAILFTMVLLSFAVYRLARRRLALLLLVSSVVLLVAIGGGLVPNLLLGSLQIYPRLNAPEWAQKNAIVVLGGGTLKDGDDVRTVALALARPFEAARLYHMCKSEMRTCHVLVSGGDPLRNVLTEAEVMARDLESVGVMKTDILVENKSANTFKNAQLTSQLLHEGSYGQTVMVTSGLHMRRALLYFNHFFVHAQPAPADKHSASRALIPVSFNFALLDFSVHEWLGIARLHIYNFLGLNPPPPPKP